MKKVLVFILAICLHVGLCACSSEKQTEPIAEPTEPTEVAIEVEALVSELGGYLEYTYSDHILNEKGQVVSRQVDGFNKRTETFEYDDQGRMVKCNMIYANDDEIYTDTYTYDESGLLVEACEGSNSFVYTYTLDEQGRVMTKKCVNINSSSGATMIYTYTYNEDGTVATETQKSRKSTYVITYTYDEKGRVSTARAVEEGERSGVTTRYTYAVVGSYVPST